MYRPILATLLCTILLALPVSATTIHVPDDYPMIMDAMVFASWGDTVLVACDTYYEGNIQMKSGVTLISETGATGCAMIDAQHMSRIIECVDCDETTAIIGFRLAGGHVMSGYGGAIFCDNSSPRLENLHIVTSQVESATGGGGGGLGCLNSSPTLTNVEFNLCVLNGSTVGGGGAMAVVGASYPVLNDVVFDRNWVTDSWGGALWLDGYSGGVVRLNNVTFIENSASTVGGGGAIQITGSPTVIDGALFEDNWAAYGGAIHYDTCRPCTLRNAIFSLNTAAYGQGGAVFSEMTPAGVLTMTDVSFLDNTAATDGGGVACSNATMPIISHAIFARNAAVNGGGLSVAGGSVEISNTTFYGNDASSTGGGIFLDASSFLNLDASIIAYSTDGEAVAQWGPTTPVVTCTDVYGNAGGDWVGVLAPFDGVYGNLWLDPLFCDAYGDDFLIAADSPCLPENNTCGVLIGASGLGCPPASGVDEPTIPSRLMLHAPSPSPFSGTSTLAFDVPAEAGRLRLTIYNARGQLIRTLVDDTVTPGRCEIVWNGDDAHGLPVTGGVYFAKCEADGVSDTRKLVVVR